MYGVLYHIAKSFPSVRGGFIHVPFIPAQVIDRPSPSPCLSMRDIAIGIEEAIKAIEETALERSGLDLDSREGKEF